MDNYNTKIQIPFLKKNERRGRKKFPFAPHPKENFLRASRSFCSAARRAAVLAEAGRQSRPASASHLVFRFKFRLLDLWIKFGKIRVKV